MVKTKEIIITLIAIQLIAMLIGNLPIELSTIILEILFYVFGYIAIWYILFRVFTNTKGEKDG